MDLTDYSSSLAYLAMASYVIGLLFREQLLLRLFMLAGSGSYIAYYYFQPSGILWDAIFATSAIASANIYGLTRLVWSRYVPFLPTGTLSTFRKLPGLQPGEFRKLIRHGEIIRNREDALLTTEGERPEYLWFIMEGTPVIRKCGVRFDLGPGAFIGEISFMLGVNASATVILPRGSYLVRWKRERLQALLTGDQGLGRAFEALLARDMARKVAGGAGLNAEKLAPPAGLAPLMPRGFQAMHA